MVGDEDFSEWMTSEVRNRERRCSANLEDARAKIGVDKCSIPFHFGRLFGHSALISVQWRLNGPSIPKVGTLLLPITMRKLLIATWDSSICIPVEIGPISSFAHGESREWLPSAC